jgi:hypothetical protein
MATAPIRPKAFANWLTEVTSTTPAPADARRHALCLFGQAAQLFTRWCPTVLAPELCNRQTFTQYDDTVFDSIAASTHLVVVRDCDVSAVWRDRKAIEEALREVHVVLLFPELQPRTSTRCWFLAERVGMTTAGSIFYCVDAMDLYKRAERADDQPPMRLSQPDDKNSSLLTVEASASVLQMKRQRDESVLENALWELEGKGVTKASLHRLAEGARKLKLPAVM